MLVEETSRTDKANHLTKKMQDKQKSLNSSVSEDAILRQLASIDPDTYETGPNKSVSWRKELIESLNSALDALFGYDLANVLKVVNVCTMLVIGLNTVMLQTELKRSAFKFTFIAWLLVGFLVIACCFIFLLNVWIAALPEGALKKEQPTEAALNEKVMSSLSKKNKKV